MMVLYQNRKNFVVKRVYTVKLVSCKFGSLADIALNSMSQGFFLGLGVGVALTIAGTYALKKTFFKSNTSIEQETNEALLNDLVSIEDRNNELNNLLTASEEKCSVLQNQVDYLEGMVMTFQTRFEDLVGSVRNSPIGRLTTELSDSFNRYIETFRPLSDAEPEEFFSSVYEYFFYDNMFFKFVFLFSLLSLALIVSYIKKREIQ